jgi:hypothetical protein
METNREKAISWWKDSKLSNEDELKLIEKYLPNRPFVGRDFLSGSEIEMIWAKENPIEALPDELINTDFEGIEEEYLINSDTCRVCGGLSKKSTGIINLHNIQKSYLRGEVEFETKQIECLKCTDCGHSWT